MPREANDPGSDQIDPGDLAQFGDAIAEWGRALQRLAWDLEQDHPETGPADRKVRVDQSDVIAERIAILWPVFRKGILRDQRPGRRQGQRMSLDRLANLLAPKR